jgi:hypothetical protein
VEGLLDEVAVVDSDAVPLTTEEVSLFTKPLNVYVSVGRV